METKRYLVTWGGYYILVESAGKGWCATVSPRGTGVSPGQGKPVKAFKGATEDEVLVAAREEIPHLPRP